jgi:hypothetical protein
MSWGGLVPAQSDFSPHYRTNRDALLFPNNPQVLSNAAAYLSLTDPQLADSWLKQARGLDPRDESIVNRLAALYADAIVGISNTGPDLLPNALDMSKPQSAFSKEAWREANRDQILAALTGLRLHYWTNFLRYKKLTTRD